MFYNIGRGAVSRELVFRKNTVIDFKKTSSLADILSTAVVVVVFDVIHHLVPQCDVQNDDDDDGGDAQDNAGDGRVERSLPIIPCFIHTVLISGTRGRH